MGDINYATLIEQMVWSYSRVESFDSCPYKWYLKYIRGFHEHDLFFSSFGQFFHKLIEQYYRGELSKEEMLMRFLTGFKTEVKGVRPRYATVHKYIDAGIQYLENFEPFPYEMIAVEDKLEFDIDGVKFVGILDYIGRDKDSGLVIVDNKSGDIRPRSGKAKPTSRDKELDKRLRQLYLYSRAVEQKYGELPKSLCFNCYRTGTFVEEPFSHDAYDEAMKWALSTIERIKEEDNFDPNQDYFYCGWLCGLNDVCEYGFV